MGQCFLKHVSISLGYDTLCLNKKVYPFYFCDNFPNCKPIQTTIGRNIAEKIWNKLTRDNFDNFVRYALRVCIVK